MINKEAHNYLVHSFYSISGDTLALGYQTVHVSCVLLEKLLKRHIVQVFQSHTYSNQLKIQLHPLFFKATSTGCEEFNARFKDYLETKTHAALQMIFLLK